jgi:hypothetical protein
MTAGWMTTVQFLTVLKYFTVCFCLKVKSLNETLAE